MTTQTAPFDFDAFLTADSKDFKEAEAPPFVAILKKAGLEDVDMELRAKYENMPEKQWVNMWEPVSFATKTGNDMPDYIRPSMNKQSKAFSFIEGAKKAKGCTIRNFGDLPKYVGTAFVVQRQTLKFGRKGNQNESQYIGILHVASDVEIQEAEQRRLGQQSAATTPDTTSLGISEDEAIIRVVGDGGTAKEIRARFLADDELKGTSLASGMMDNTALTDAVERGLLEKNGNNYTVRAASAPSAEGVGSEA